jgi:SPP1 family predicted phage head-tail adaptor
MDKTAGKNCRITIRKYIYGQDQYGGPIKEAVLIYAVWAEVKRLSGNRSMDNLQLTYDKTWRITKRHEVSRVLQPDDEIIYDTQTLSIQEVHPDNEGRQAYDIITAKSAPNTQSSDQPVIPTVTGDFHYVSPGGNYSFPTGELNFDSILCFRDGIQYTVIISGDPSGKQVLYNQSTGVFEFDTDGPAMQLNEVVDVYFLSRT